MSTLVSKSRRTEIITLLESGIGDPSKGLPEEIFLFASRIVPLINVDLLVKNKQGQTLLTWREDAYWKPGWHIPGGIIRYRETIADRIKKTALSEIGSAVRFQKVPLTIKEFILPEMKSRCHFLSLLYRCSLSGVPDRTMMYRSGIPKPGEWAWHDKCPRNLLSVHKVYREFM